MIFSPRGGQNDNERLTMNTDSDPVKVGTALLYFNCMCNLHGVMFRSQHGIQSRILNTVVGLCPIFVAQGESYRGEQAGHMPWGSGKTPIGGPFSDLARLYGGPYKCLPLGPSVQLFRHWLTALLPMAKAVELPADSLMGLQSLE